MKKLSINILLILLILTGCFKENTIKLNLFSNPQGIDTQVLEGSSDKIIIAHIFEGLTTEDAKGKIVPAIAESWDVNRNVWTFNLNKDAKWHNGKNVTAEDFITAWERVLNSKNNNKNAYMLYPIKGAMEYNQGTIIDFKAVGIKALSENVLQVELSMPNPYFSSLVAHPIFYPINKEFYKKHKEEYGLNKRNILGNGPYEIEKWDNKKIVLKKSKKYRDMDKIKIKKINLILNGDSAQLKKMYGENKLDILDLPLSDTMEYKDNEEKINFGTGEISYLQINTKNSILSNKKIRKALALAIDRKEFVKIFKEETGEIAESFIPSNVGEDKKLFRLEYPQKRYENTYNVNKAREFWQQGLNELGLQQNNIKNITLLIKANEEEVGIANFLKIQLKKNLNLDISMISETSQMREQIMNSGDYDITYSTLSTDIPDISSYLKIWSADSYSNLTGWSNSEYDNLIKIAMLEKDSKKRTEKFAVAETVLMGELPIIPLSFSKKTFIIKDRIEGITLSNVSKELNFKYASIKK